ncbi:MAG: GIY-YIG nuclease family protein [Candidatus Gastranaerophilales bacterium]|nr:GIY-YIG nuclease family protein [Candidatus Gastranaerophilales bacterium]
MKKDSYVYILTNKYNKVFYIGVTSDLVKRIWEHKNKVAEGGFSKQYNLNKLIYYEIAGDIESAIAREKQLKRWHRQWKINLIKDFNSTFEDLYEKII